ncbi:MAG: hypothetical protein RLZZ618_213 [Pseudomonadota bacterium]|jgi:ABC-type multidrug transport system ATPase subunit
MQRVRRVHGSGKRVHFELEVDLQIAEPEVIGLFGSNGAGKSTLLNLIAGKVDPSAGSVRVGGHGLSQIRRGQRHLVVRHQSQARGEAPEKGRFDAMTLHPREWMSVAIEGMRDLARRKAPTSGPRIFLFDEPSMAPPYGGLMFDRFARLRDQGNLVIFSAHPSKASHLDLIRGVCDRYAFMDDGRLTVMNNHEEFLAHPDVADYMRAWRHMSELALA